CTPEKCAEALRHLIDLNLVLSMDHQFAISFPVKEAVERLRGHLTEDDYRKIASHLLKVFWKNPNEIPELSVVDATIHAMARCDIKEFEKFQDLILPSQLYRVAKEEYDSKNWDSAIQFAVRTLQLDSARDGARIILCKAYVRKERWDEAEREIRTLAQRGVRARFYCKGFLEWKHGHLELAVDAFRSALDAGDTSISVYRDLAHCLFRSAHIDQAKQVLKKAPERIFHNNYVVDLLVQIAIAERDWPEAERHVSVLEHIATKQDFYYRRSTLKSAGGQWIPALQDIENSLKESTTPRFEIVAQKADILIELGHFPDAAAAIDTMIPSSPVKRDVKSGLKCKLLLRQGKWPEAEIVWAGLGQKSEPVHKVLRKEILILKAADIMASPTEREDASKELALIGEPVQLLLSDVSEDID
ncbi:MAG: hypothetical protein NTZ34_12440, partial [Chloroflexi bacterium]|nr:hypothetical protein [Chloroflexota bacterium]